MLKDIGDGEVKRAVHNSKIPFGTDVRVIMGNLQKMLKLMQPE